MGNLPLAGDFNAGPEAIKYPLAIDLCTICGLLQVRETVDHSVLFNENYCYASSTVPALVRHFEEFARTIPSGCKVFEIAPNDGVLLAPLGERGILCAGMDASANIVRLAQERGCNVICGFFNKESSSRAADLVPGGKYDIVTCSNVFAHNPDPDSIMEGVREILKPGGTLIIEVHDAKKLHALLQWDCFYHEHCFYWTQRALQRYLWRHGFRTVNCTELTMHGGAFRMISRWEPELGEHAQFLSYVSPEEWREFGDRARRSRNTLNELMEDLGTTYNIKLLGAAGRASTLVNWANLQSFIQCAYDGSPLRIGKQIPGTSIRIRDEQELLEPTVCEGRYRYGLLGAWHLRESLIKKFKHPFNLFICPLPNATIY